MLVTDKGTLLVIGRKIIQSFVPTSAAAMILVKSLLAVIAMVVSFHCNSAYSGHITMVTGFSTTMKPEGLLLEVSAENRGDVPAHDVQFEITVDDKVYVSPQVKMLGVAQKTSVGYTLTDGFESPGRYPVVIRTYYKDANVYPFTAVTVGFYDYRSAVMPAVSIRSEATEMTVNGKGQVRFVLHNDGPGSKKIDLSLYIPNELSVSNDYADIEIGPQREATLVYNLENYSALANSSYQVSLVGQYQEAGSHFGFAGSTVVRIVGDVESAVRPFWIWVVLGGIIPGVLVWLRVHEHALYPGRSSK